MTIDVPGGPTNTLCTFIFSLHACYMPCPYTLKHLYEIRLGKSLKWLIAYCTILAMKRVLRTVNTKNKQPHKEEIMKEKIITRKTWM
jgi:uncharacterized PurR-regulated membrane protein YhhQ (DUF165 family)